MTNLTALITDEFDGAWNARDIEQVMNHFADDAVVKPVPALPGAPEIFQGKEQIRGFVELIIPGFRVVSSNVQVEGNKVTWFATVSDDYFRQAGADSMDANCEAIVQDGKIKFFSPAFTPESLAKLQAAASSAGR